MSLMVNFGASTRVQTRKECIPISKTQSAFELNGSALVLV